MQNGGGNCPKLFTISYTAEGNKWEAEKKGIAFCGLLNSCTGLFVMDPGRSDSGALENVKRDSEMLSFALHLH